MLTRYISIFYTDRPNRELHKAIRKVNYLSSPTLQYNKQRRINGLDIKIKYTDNKSSKEFEYDYLIIAVDSTGIKITNRGQWMEGEK